MLDFLIVGAQKAGTTAAAFNLNLHPRVSVFGGKTEFGQRELEFFNQHWDKGIPWYLAHFEGLTGIRGEKTAELLHRTACHARIKSTCPQVKLIVLLRCPVRRAFSQWRMAAFDKRDEDRSFEQAVAGELAVVNDRLYRQAFYDATPSAVSPWREGYLLKGLYVEQLKSLASHFQRREILVLVSERVVADKRREYSRAFDFLGVATLDLAFQDRFHGKGHPSLEPSMVALLSEFYRGPNEALFDWLGYRVEEWA